MFTIIRLIKLKILFLLFMAVSFNANAFLWFNNTEPPNCNLDEVSELVISIVKPALKQKFFSPTVAKMTLNRDIDFIVGEAMISEPDYKKWEKQKANNESVNIVITKIDNMIEESNLELSSIRTISKDENTKKSRCSAELKNSNGNSLQVKYSAQLTDDGDEIYVEVFNF